MIPANGRGLNQERAKGTRSAFPYEIFAALLLSLMTQVLFCSFFFPRAVGEDEQPGGLSGWEAREGKIELLSAKAQPVELARTSSCVLGIIP